MREQSNFGTLLKHYRLAAGLSQETLAARASLSTRTISDLERGVHTVPRSDTLELLTGVLSLTDQQRTLLLSSARPARRLRRSSPELPHLAFECGPGRPAGKSAPLRFASRVTGCAGPCPPVALAALGRARQVGEGKRGGLPIWHPSQPELTEGAARHDREDR